MRILFSLGALLLSAQPLFAKLVLDCQAVQRCNTTVGGCHMPAERIPLQAVLQDDLRSGILSSDGNRLRLIGNGTKHPVLGSTWQMQDVHGEVAGLFSFDVHEFFVLTMHHEYEGQVTGLSLTGFCYQGAG